MTDKSPQTYQILLNRLKNTIEQSSSDTWQGLSHYIAIAREKAVELDELTREEAEHISEYLRKDIQDAAEYLNETGEELGDWLRFDLAQIEENFLSLFSGMVDHTREGLRHLAADAEQASRWYSGETTGAGTLRCTQCGAEQDYTSPKKIPPCPQCGHTEFDRVWHHKNT